MRARLTLAKGHLLCIEDGRGIFVRVEYGALVATQERDFDDTPVGPAKPFTVTRQGKTILSARSDSAVLLEGGAARVQVKQYLGPAPIVIRELARAA